MLSIYVIASDNDSVRFSTRKYSISNLLLPIFRIPKDGDEKWSDEKSLFFRLAKGLGSFSEEEMFSGRDELEGKDVFGTWIELIIHRENKFHPTTAIKRYTHQWINKIRFNRSNESLWCARRR